MSQVIINDVELDIDMEDADFQERYEAAFEKMSGAEKKLQKAGKASEITRGYCDMFYSLFDDIFGDGTGEKLFKGKRSISLVNDTYDQFISVCSQQAKEAQNRMKKMVSKYAPNKGRR
jgi:hypothetical protein